MWQLVTAAIKKGMEKELVIGKNKTERKVRHIIKLVTAVGMWDSVPVGTL